MDVIGIAILGRTSPVSGRGWDRAVGDVGRGGLAAGGGATPVPLGSGKRRGHSRPLEKIAAD